MLKFDRLSTFTIYTWRYIHENNMELEIGTDSLSENLDNVEFARPLGDRQNRRVYLITYSRANLKTIPDCEAFSKCILEAFDEGKSNKKVVEWACCMEDHADGGKHYHMAVSLDGTRRWNPVRNSIFKKYGINVHFSSRPHGYVAAYRYVCKNKTLNEVLHSPGHTDMTTIGSPKTKNAMGKSSSSIPKAHKRKAGEDHDNDQDCETSKPKTKRLSNFDVAQFMVANNVETKSELMRLALRRSENGDNDLHAYILNRTPKALADLIETTWMVQDAPKVAERESKSRIEIIEETAKGPCQSKANGCVVLKRCLQRTK